MNINQQIIDLLSYSAFPPAQTENTTPDTEITKRAQLILDAIKDIAKSAQSNLDASKKMMSYECFNTDATARIWIKEGICFETGMELVVEHLKTLGFSKVIGHFEIVQSLSLSAKRPLQKFIINADKIISPTIPPIDQQKNGS